jgi:hypothetical protein
VNGLIMDLMSDERLDGGEVVDFKGLSGAVLSGLCQLQSYLWILSFASEVGECTAQDGTSTRQESWIKSIVGLAAKSV